LLKQCSIGCLLQEFTLNIIIKSFLESKKKACLVGDMDNGSLAVRSREDSRTVSDSYLTPENKFY